MSRSGSSKRRVDAKRLPEEEFKGAVDSALKEGDAAPVLAWAEALAGDVGASAHLVEAWSSAMRDPADVRDPSALLWPLAALRKGLQRGHLERLAVDSSRLLGAEASVVWSRREDDLARALLCLVLEDAEGEKLNLGRYLEAGRDYRSFRIANLFALLGTPNMDVVRAHFAPRSEESQAGAGRRPALLFDIGDGLAAKFARSKALRRARPARSRRQGDAGAGVGEGRTWGDLPQGGVRVHTPPVADVERSTEEGEDLGEDPASIASRRGKKRSASEDERSSNRSTEGSPDHQDAHVDLKREFFSRGPEVAQVLLLQLAAELASRYPGVKKSIKPLLIAAIDRESYPAVESAGAIMGQSPQPTVEAMPPTGSEGTVRRSKRIELPERTGDPLIHDLANIWDRRKALSRREFVQMFQVVLDEFHRRKRLDTYAANETLVGWIKIFARAERIKLMLCADNNNYVAVTIRCLNRRQSGYFVPRIASRNPSVVRGRSSSDFPKLIAVAL